MLKRLIAISLASSAVIAIAGVRLSHSARAAAIPSAPADTAINSPTFNKDVAPILFENCSNCHHPGEVAPFSLLSYADAKKHSTEIGDLTQKRQMPPWKPEHGFGDFRSARRLSDGQIDTIQRWVKAGRPEGNAADLPPAPKFAEGWTLGPPDLVVKMPKAFTLHADGNDVFRSFVVPLNLTEDKYVEAVEFRPDNRKIVHHALLFLDSSGRAKAQDGADGDVGFGKGPGGLGFVPSGGLGGWAPGVTTQRLPEGVARLIHKNADLVIQTHFHPSGKVETEQATVGLYFAKKPPEKLFVSMMKGAKRASLDIPAGDKNFEISNTFTVPSNVTLQGVFPHAHLLCKEIEVTATLPDGKDIPIIWIKNWDWDWQDEYLYAKPLEIPRGTQVHMRFRYDNSADNLRNPTKPPREVRWGEQTADEMALCFFQILVDRPLVEAFDGARGVNADPETREKLRKWAEALKKQNDETKPADKPAAGK